MLKKMTEVVATVGIEPAVLQLMKLLQWTSLPCSVYV